MSDKEKKNRKKTGLGLAIWILLFLIILIVFLVKQEEIKENFDKSGASALIEKKIGKDIFEKKDNQDSQENDSGEVIIDLTKKVKKPEPIVKSEQKKEETASKEEEKKAEPQKVEAVKTNTPKTEVSLKQPEKTEKPQTTKQEAPKEEVNPQVQTKKTKEKEAVQTRKEEKVSKPKVQKPETAGEVKRVVKEEVKPAPKKERPPVVEAPSNTLNVKVCFVAIDSDGPVVRKEVTRTVEKDSPMGDALRLLLAGPNASESKTGCRSLIPQGTRLLSASVKNGIATLNFSEEFQFNQFGAEGSLAQLMQVVYTATNFNTVKSVQILIEGQKRDYLTEGVWIGSPLNRGSF